MGFALQRWKGILVVQIKLGYFEPDCGENIKSYRIVSYRIFTSTFWTADPVEELVAEPASLWVMMQVEAA